MRVAVLSDIHSNLEALTKVLQSIGTVDRYLCLGDTVGYGANPNEVIQLIRQHRMQTIKGNHDEAVLTGDVRGFNPIAAAAIAWTGRKLSHESLSFLKTLPLRVDLELQGLHIHAVHGSPENPLEDYVYADEPRERLESFLRLTSAELLLLGHTHCPMDVQLESGRVLNPGSVGQPRDRDPRASFAILEIEEGAVRPTIHRVTYDVESTARKILEAGLPSFDAERLYVGM